MARASKIGTTETPRAPAKIRPPRLSAVYLRNRLFRQLDQARQRSVVWIAAPAGYGKTTLVASYLEARQTPTVWYQLDEGDADIATYFHYLGLAARLAAPRARWALPAFTPEYFANLPVFARRIFEQLAMRLPAGTVVVLDNYQDVPANAPLHEVIHDSFTQIPVGINVIVISRREPPPAYVGDRANGVITLVGQEELRLTERESAGMCRARFSTRQNIAQLSSSELHQRADGWAAGLVLMMERRGNEQTLFPRLTDAPPNAVFDYFYRELFEKADLATQQVLLRTAYLPTVSPAAAEVLSGNPRAGEILRQLYRDNFFTLMRTEPATVFQYHPLLRDFLVAQCELSFPKQEKDGLLRLSAELLMGDGRTEDAAHLLLAAGDWSKLAELIELQAPALLERGSHRMVSEWLDRIPTHVRDADPWLCFWQGSCRLPFDATDAREFFTRAYAEFRRRADAVGSFLAWSSAVDSIVFEWDNFAQLEHWISELEPLRLAFPDFPSPQIEARVISSMFSALMYQEPAHPEMELWCKRLEVVVKHTGDPSARVLLGAHLVIYNLVWLGKLATAESMLQSIRPPSAAKLSPIAEILWQACLANWCWMNALPEEGLAAVAAAQRVTDEHGVTLWSFIVNSAGADIHLACGRVQEAAPYIAQLQRLLTPRRRIDHAHNLIYTAWLASLEGDHTTALAASRASLAIHGRHTDAMTGLSDLAHAQFFQKTGQFDEAFSHAASALQLGKAIRSPHFQYHALLLQAWICFGSARGVSGLEHLRAAFTIGREQGYSRLTLYCNDDAILAQLCARALEAGIEVEFAKRMIRDRRLKPPAGEPNLEAWPLPVKIYTLGRFSLLLEGERLKFGGKAQKKPIELLQALIAFGGRDVREDTLAEALWPDADADAAANALTSTLHRLRTLVGADVVVRQSGRLSLDACRCWVDVWSFERQLTALEKAHRTEAWQDSQRLTDAVVDLYRGAFLQNEGELPWALAARSRVQTRFLRVLEGVGAAHVRTGRLEQAAVCFGKAVEVDLLAENAYRGLMQVSLSRGRHAEALSVYQRCRKMLSVGLGCAPSTETEALVRQIPTG